MKVALCGPYPLDPTQRPGGVIAVVVSLCQGLRHRDDVDLHIVTTTKGLAEDKTVSEQGATVHYLASPTLKVVPNLITNINRFERKIEEIKPDIVHGQAPVATLAALRTSYPTVHTVHGIPHREVQYASGLKAKAGTWLEGVFARKVVCGVKHYIAIAKYSADAYGDVTNAKMHLIYNPVDDAFFGVPDHEEPHRLFFGGNVIDRKNVLGHLEVVRRLVGKYPDVKLRIAGGTPDPAYYEQCRAFVARYKLEANVEFLGMTPIEQMLEEHSRAAVVLLLSKQETASVVVSEALCAGKPVVASTAGGTAELVQHGETGFVAPWEDTDAFVGYIDQLLSSDELRKEMGRTAREIAKQRFSIASVANDTVEVYKEVIADK